MLRENRSRFDVVISDVHMPNMDGFKLLELVRLETDVPVIMMSANGETSNVMKGISQGACDYLLKPVRIEELQNIWQHVVRRKQSICKQSGCASSPKGCQQPRQEDGGTSLQLDDVENEFCSSLKKRKEVKDEDSQTEEDNLNSVKRQRVVWSVGLHQKFVSAVNQLGLEQAVPKRILDLMNVPGLTRENVASHLQKFRLYLKRISGSVNQQAGMISCTETSIDSFAWINGHAESQPVCQLPKVLVTPQMGTGGRLDPFNGEAMHCKESPSVNQLPAELHVDQRDLLLPQCIHPTLQIQSVDPLLEDPINVCKSEFMPPPGQLNMFSQNRSGHLMLEQCHRVPHLSGVSFVGGLNYSEIEHSNTNLKAMHHLLHVAQPESQNNVLPSLNGLVGLQQGFEEFPIKSMLHAVDCYTKKGLENGDLTPDSMPSNDHFLLEKFYKDSKSNLNPWVSAPKRTFTLSMPCLPEDSRTMSIPKVINDDEARWRTTNKFLSSCDMNTVKVGCSPLREWGLRSEESELNEGKDPDLILSMQGISGKQVVHSGFLNVQFEKSSNQEKPLCPNSYADLGWSRAVSNSNAVIEELPTGSVAVFRQGQISR